jgi:hypothetical protein
MPCSAKEELKIHHWTNACTKRQWLRLVSAQAYGTLRRRSTVISTLRLCFVGCHDLLRSYDPVSEGAEFERLYPPVWHRGAVRRGAGQLALAARLYLPAGWTPGALPAAHARTLPVQPLQALRVPGLGCTCKRFSFQIILSHKFCLPHGTRLSAPVMGTLPRRWRYCSNFC